MITLLGGSSTEIIEQLRKSYLPLSGGTLSGLLNFKLNTNYSSDFITFNANSANITCINSDEQSIKLSLNPNNNTFSLGKLESKFNSNNNIFNIYHNNKRLLTEDDLSDIQIEPSNNSAYVSLPVGTIFAYASSINPPNSFILNRTRN